MVINLINLINLLNSSSFSDRSNSSIGVQQGSKLASTTSPRLLFPEQTWLKSIVQCACSATRLPSPKRGLVSTTSSTWCMLKELLSTGMSGRVWKRASFVRQERIWPHWKRTTRKLESIVPIARLSEARRKIYTSCHNIIIMYYYCYLCFNYNQPVMMQTTWVTITIAKMKQKKEKPRFPKKIRKGFFFRRYENRWYSWEALKARKN